MDMSLPSSRCIRLLFDRTLCGRKVLRVLAPLCLVDPTHAAVLASHRNGDTLRLLHKMENCISERGVGGNDAGAVLAAASAANNETARRLGEERLRTAEERRARALSARERILNSLGLVIHESPGCSPSPSPGITPPASPSHSLLASSGATLIPSPGRAASEELARLNHHHAAARRRRSRSSFGASSMSPSQSSPLNHAASSPLGSTPPHDFMALAAQAAATSTDASPDAALFNLDLEEEEEPEEPEHGGLRCVICREGYDERPSEALAVYCLCVPNDNEEVAYTVSHFSAIHVSCHESARRADSRLRQPKSEWQGGQLRNRGSRCNALLPVPPPRFEDTRDEDVAAMVAYKDAAEAYWRRVLPASMSTSVSRSTWLSRCLHAIYEVRQLALRVVGVGRRVDADAGGGSRESNSKTLALLAEAGRNAASESSETEIPRRLAVEMSEIFKAKTCESSVKASEILANVCSRVPACGKQSLDAFALAATIAVFGDENLWQSSRESLVEVTTAENLSAARPFLDLLDCIVAEQYAEGSQSQRRWFYDVERGIERLGQVAESIGLLQQQLV